MQKHLGNLLLVLLLLLSSAVYAEHAFDGSYTGANLNRIAFPIGGTGAGMFCIEGTGAITSMSIHHGMEFFHEPCAFAAVCVLGDTPEKNTARLLEGPLSDWKYFGTGGSGNGSGGKTYGLPRFKECTFSCRFPFATIDLKDKSLPIDVQLLAWSPFTPPDADSSGLPVGAVEYKFTNRSDTPQKAIFSFSTKNFMRGRDATIGAFDKGFALYDELREGDDPETVGGFAVYVEGVGTDNVKPVVDHCWFRGGWWDAFTIAWDNVEKGRLINNPPVSRNAPGATLAVPFDLKPGESKTLRLLTAWYVPTSSLSIGNDQQQASSSGSAFTKPAAGGGSGQQPVEGYLGNKLVNTFNPGGDGRTGTLISPAMTLAKKNIHFLVGGGEGPDCAIQLMVNDIVVRSTSGRNEEKLVWASWDVAEFAGKEAKIRIVDHATGGWGHINVDHIVMSDEPIADLRTGKGNEIVTDPGRVSLIADFEGETFGDWVVEDFKSPTPPSPAATAECPPGSACCAPGDVCCQEPVPSNYVPWYARKYKSLREVADTWSERYDELKKRSEKFTNAFYDSTLPPEVLEAVAANLTILKSPTVLRQHDGRLWCWEGCGDGGGCCSGSCTHVWNYAQAICHLFPSLERSLRQTEYFEGTREEGRQAFRVNLPITPGGHSWDASDGQLGGIMKAYREWKILGDDAWLKAYWPRIKLSMDYMIKKYDPRHTGLLEEDHHNTYDINYFGPDGHCGSFYLGALQAMVEMGTYLKDDVTFYKQLLEAGQKRIVKDLYNGEFFIQIVQKEGLNHNFGPINPKDQSEGYRAIAEKVNEQGPKYQYGIGCLSDGVLGLWIAKAAGIDADIVDPALVKSHLMAIFKYNFRADLSEHANPQRPSYALGDDGGLLLCTWPNGGKPLLPFVYSDEVWTGIEYQVASHLMLLGCVDEGLAIVKAVRKRHDGVRRNPYNEYECGHWYARAMSSYGLIQGLTGVRYEAGTKTLYVDSRVGDFRSFLSTNTGYGTVVYKDGKAMLEVKSGTIPVDKVVVAGK